MGGWAFQILKCKSCIRGITSVKTLVSKLDNAVQQQSSLVWQSNLVSDSLRAILKPSVVPYKASLFSLDTEARQFPVPCQGKPCKSILVRARAETRGGEACDTCMSERAKSSEARTRLCSLNASKSLCGGKVWILPLSSWASCTKILIPRERESTSQEDTAL